MFLLVISVGRDWSVHSVLEFSAMKKNLRIMSDIERVIWTVLFCMASRVFLYFTPSDSNVVRNWFVCREPRTPVVKLICESFQPLFSRLLRWLMKPLDIWGASQLRTGCLFILMFLTPIVKFV